MTLYCKKILTHTLDKIDGDVSVELQNLINENNSIHLPAGVYEIHNTIVLNKNNFTLTGESGTILRKTADVHLLEIHGNNNKIDTIQFDGNSKNYSVVFLNGNNNVINHCKFYNSLSHGLCIDGQLNVTSYNEVNGCYMYDNEHIGLAQHKGSNTRITNNLIFNNGWEGLTIDIQSHDTIVDSNKLFGNCWRDGGGEGAIGIDDSNNNIISNNIIDGPHRDNSLLGGITFANNIGNCERNVIIGNVIKNTRGYPIFIRNKNGITANYNVINSNVCFGNNLTIIKLDDGCVGNIIEHNLVN